MILPFLAFRTIVPRGTFNHKVGSTFSGAAFCTAIFAPLCDIFFVVTEIEQRRQVGVYLKDDIAAFAPFPPSGPPAATYFSDETKLHRHRRLQL